MTALLGGADRHALAACDAAGAELRSLGFRHVYTSRQSEACYYALPDHPGVIRVAAHRYGHTEQRCLTRPLLALITFGANQGPVSLLQVENSIIAAVGRYFMARLRVAEGAVNPSTNENA